ncbi:hypothetical protein IFM89_016378 [Coptis chinensis]|uniref:Uncharacterized protein n=1 Tax=Coptis chinensis TaxID=261450 RepID=A0A835HF70_9MAGN|nr:hypothetical protein IFM89_016378 [Coptis chinensis]
MENQCRKSRGSRRKAEDALLDYLHNTRSIQFSEAEYISKNSPVFVGNLLTKVKNEQEIVKSLSSALCNYGIPRNKIGRMYKEVRDIFGYNEGVLILKLQGYEKLGLSAPTVIKLVSCSPSLLVSGVNEDFVGVLEKLKGLGLSSDCKKDIGQLFEINTAFLIENSGKKVYVLISMLLKVGLKMNDIGTLFLEYPRILAGKFAENLLQAMQFMSEIGMEAEDISKLVRSHTQVLGSNSLRKPVTVLSDLNVGPDRLSEMIMEDPTKFTSLASRWKPIVKKVAVEKGVYDMEKTAFLLSIGYVENSEEMVKALKRFRGRGDQLQQRFDCLVKAGLDCHTVSNMVKAAPPVLNLSEHLLEMKIEYLVKDLGYPLQSLEVFPAYLCYDIERIKLRCSMYMWYREKVLEKSRKALSTILATSDTKFVKHFVNVHPEGPAEWKRLKKPFRKPR